MIKFIYFLFLRVYLISKFLLTWALLHEDEFGIWIPSPIEGNSPNERDGEWGGCNNIEEREKKRIAEIRCVSTIAT